MMGQSNSAQQFSHLPYSLAVKRGATQTPHVVKLNPITNKITEVIEEDSEYHRIMNEPTSSHLGGTQQQILVAPLGFKRGPQASRGGAAKENTDHIKKKSKPLGINEVGSGATSILSPSHYGSASKTPGNKKREESRFDEVSSVFYRT